MIKIDENDPVGELEQSFPFRDVSIKHNTDIKQFYELHEEIGRGKFGKVHKCREKCSGLMLAVKFVKTASRKDKRDVEREIDIMKELQHPRLIQIYDAYESNNVMCVVLELIEGGELFDKVIDKDFIFTEKSVTVFMRQICEGVDFMHSKRILHLDMKPENILCLTKTGNRIKIIDFGLARKYDPEKKMQVLFGTPEFVAPEVVNFESIGFGTDMWSVGVICYVLLSGLSPFMGDTDVATMANVTIAEYDFDDEAFDEISQDAQNFISRLLVKNREDRMSARECLEHEWLRRKNPPIIIEREEEENNSEELEVQKDNLRNLMDKWTDAAGGNNSSAALNFGNFPPACVIPIDEMAVEAEFANNAGRDFGNESVAIDLVPLVDICISENVENRSSKLQSDGVNKKDACSSNSTDSKNGIITESSEIKIKQSTCVVDNDKEASLKVIKNDSVPLLKKREKTANSNTTTVVVAAAAAGISPKGGSKSPATIKPTPRVNKSSTNKLLTKGNVIADAVCDTASKTDTKGPVAKVTKTSSHRQITKTVQCSFQKSHHKSKMTESISVANARESFEGDVAGEMRDVSTTPGKTYSVVEETVCEPVFRKKKLRIKSIVETRCGKCNRTECLNSSNETDAVVDCTSNIGENDNRRKLDVPTDLEFHDSFSGNARCHRRISDISGLLSRINTVAGVGSVGVAGTSAQPFSATLPASEQTSKIPSYSIGEMFKSKQNRSQSLKSADESGYAISPQGSIEKRPKYRLSFFNRDVPFGNMSPLNRASFLQYLSRCGPRSLKKFQKSKATVVGNYPINFDTYCKCPSPERDDVQDDGNAAARGGSGN